MPALEKSSAGFFMSSHKKEIMFWITLLAIAMAAALVKLGVALVMVSILTGALWATGLALAVGVSYLIWHIRRR